MSRPGDKPRKGIRFGKYLLLRPLGSGGMSQVWLAIRDIGASEKNCTIKMTLDLVGLDEFRRQGIITEVRVGGRLRNSQIVQIVDAGECGKVAYIELEYVDGVDLRQLLTEMRSQRAQVSIPLAVYILRGVLEALYFAHERHQIGGVPEVVIHRDLTPDNVIISSAGEVKVMDFGIGKLAADKATGAFVKGKWRYMPPEQTRGDTNVQTDLFYVGAMLYELLEGVRFRNHITPEDMDIAAARGEVPELTRRDVPPELARLYSALVAKNPAERVRSASLAIKLLKQWPGLPADADDMRTTYERYARATAHSGYTHGDFEYPTELEHLMRAVLAAGPEQPPALITNAEADAPQARHERPASPDRLKTTADAPMPVRLGLEASPPSVGTLPLGTPRHAPVPERTEVWAPMLGTPGITMARPMTVATDKLAPTFGGGPSRIAVPIPETAAFDSGPDLAARDTESTDEGSEPPIEVPSSLRRTASVGPEGTAFVVVRHHGPRLLGALALGMIAIAGVVAGLTLTRGVGVDAPDSVGRTVHDEGEIAEVVLTPDEPLLEPVLGPRSDEPTPTLVEAPTPRVAVPEIVPPSPTPVPPVVAEDVAPPAVEPVPMAKRKPKPAPKPEVEIRFTPMAAEGEVRIGRKKIVAIANTIDTRMRVGEYKLAWRLRGAAEWTSAEPLVLEDGRLYLVRFGPKGPRVSSQAIKP